MLSNSFYDDLDTIDNTIVHIYLSQRKGKHLTSVEGLPKEIDQHVLLKDLKRLYSCGGFCEDDKIILFGDVREKLSIWLITNIDVKTKVHGY